MAHQDAEEKPLAPALSPEYRGEGVVSLMSRGLCDRDRFAMNMQTFRATTMAEALSQVKASMGLEAVILHTRTFHTRSFLGLRRREMVEITAGKGLNIPDRNSRRAAIARQQQHNVNSSNGNGNGA